MLESTELKAKVQFWFLSSFRARMIGERRVKWDENQRQSATESGEETRAVMWQSLQRPVIRYPCLISIPTTYSSVSLLLPREVDIAVQRQSTGNDWYRSPEFNWVAPGILLLWLRSTPRRHRTRLRYLIHLIVLLRVPIILHWCLTSHRFIRSNRQQTYNLMYRQFR